MIGGVAEQSSFCIVEIVDWSRTYGGFEEANQRCLLTEDSGRVAGFERRTEKSLPLASVEQRLVVGGTVAGGDRSRTAEDERSGVLQSNSWESAGSQMLAHNQ